MDTKKIAFFIAILGGTLFCSLWSPKGDFTATPKYWWDESFTIEIARTILETGKIDVTVAPNTPSHSALTVNANGFPLSLPLAGFFHLFGIGLFQARIYMIIWILATVTLLFFFLRDLFGAPLALSGTLLVATFASFYANGRTATGDIQGFFFLITGLWIIVRK